jgi:urea transporter
MRNRYGFPGLVKVFTINILLKLFFILTKSFVMNNNKPFILAPYLKGVGQIMLQDSAWTGLLFLTGIFYDSFILGLAAVIAVTSGTLTAMLCRYDEDEINMGLYGFNATLVGVALATFFQPQTIIWIAIIAGSALSTIITHFFIKKKFSAFTFPFIVITWALVYIFKNVHVVPPPIQTAVTEILNNDFTITSHGFGEVIFQASTLAGILFFIGVFVSSPVGALYGLAGSVISAALAFYMKAPTADITMGMFSFNAVLCAITFSGCKQKDGLFVLLAVVMSLIIEAAMIRFSLTPYLTFPFVMATWITLLIKKLLPAK